MQKIEKNLTKIPAQITLKKIQKSDLKFNSYKNFPRRQQ